MNSFLRATAGRAGRLLLVLAAIASCPAALWASEAAPTVTATEPANGATNVSVYPLVTVTFSEPMDVATFTSSSLTLRPVGGEPLLGTVAAPTSRTATFRPTADLASNTTYIATVTTSVTARLGTHFGGYSWHFTTNADTTQPEVVSCSPIDATTGVPTNRRILATFNEPMDPATLSAATFTLTRDGGAAVSGTVTCEGAVAEFVPQGDLAASTHYTARVTRGARDLMGHSLATPAAWSFETGGGPDVAEPAIASTAPLANASLVPLDAAVSVVFAQEMDPLTLTSASFFLSHGGTTVAASVTCTSRTAVLRPTASLALGTTYTATVTTAVKSVVGNALAYNTTWTFYTTPDATPPAVASVSPANHATGVTTGTALTVVFSEAMDAATITTATLVLRQGTTPIRGTVAYAGETATFTPTAALAANTTFTATVVASVTDAVGNAMASDFVWTFVTGLGGDTTAPTILSTNPTDGATGVSVDQAVTATFSEAMDPATITSATFTLCLGSTPVAGTVRYTGVTATFTPLANFVSDTVYTAAISTGATDVAGNPMAAERVWSFTSGNTLSNVTTAAVVVYKRCTVTAGTDFSLTVTKAAGGTIKITTAEMSGVQQQAALAAKAASGGTLVLAQCASIPSVSVRGNLAAFFTQVPVTELTATGSLGRVTAQRCSVETLRARTIDSVVMSGVSDFYDAYGDSGTSGTLAATTIYTQGGRDDGMSIALTGVVLEDLVTSQTLESVSVSSRRVPKSLTGGVGGVVSMGGIGRVAGTDADGVVATEFRLQAQGIAKVKATGASILPDNLDSTRNNIFQLTANSQNLAGHVVGGLVGETGNSMQVMAPNIGVIRGNKGVHGEFIAGTSTTSHPGLILMIATSAGKSNLTTGTTPISGDAYVGRADSIIFIPNQGTMTVHSNSTSSSLTLAPAAIRDER